MDKYLMDKYFSEAVDHLCNNFNSDADRITDEMVVRMVGILIAKDSTDYLVNAVQDISQIIAIQTTILKGE